MKDWKTTTSGVLAALCQIAKAFVKPEYQPALDAATGVFLGSLGYHAVDKAS